MLRSRDDGRDVDRPHGRAAVHRHDRQLGLRHLRARRRHAARQPHDRRVLQARHPARAAVVDARPAHRRARRLDVELQDHGLARHVRAALDRRRRDVERADPGERAAAEARGLPARRVARCRAARCCSACTAASAATAKKARTSRRARRCCVPTTAATTGSTTRRWRSTPRASSTTRSPRSCGSADGRIVGMLRTHVNPSGDAKNMAIVVSEDDGFSWTPPRFTNIWGYPAEFATLPDGRILDDLRLPAPALRRARLRVGRRHHLGRRQRVHDPRGRRAGRVLRQPGRVPAHRLPERRRCSATAACSRCTTSTTTTVTGRCSSSRARASVSPTDRRCDGRPRRAAHADRADAGERGRGVRRGAAPNAGYNTRPLTCHFPSFGMCVGYAATRARDAPNRAPGVAPEPIDEPEYWKWLQALAATRPSIVVLEDLDDPPGGAMWGEWNGQRAPRARVRRHDHAGRGARSRRARTARLPHVRDVGVGRARLRRVRRLRRPGDGRGSARRDRRPRWSPISTACCASRPRSRSASWSRPAARSTGSSRRSSRAARPTTSASNDSNALQESVLDRWPKGRSPGTAT